MKYPLARPSRLSLDQFAAAAGLHPQQVRRLVALGLLDPVTNAGERVEFPPSQLAVAARVQRLRIGLGLNYAAVGVVLDLLARIEELEAALRAARRL
ncbi:MAG: chaperone modulator CbpM [Actinomycetota bacterium]|jgi:chaperone modulatory protein CbpM|nr:chaperone modulator CbpM [Actinomycetota bacterium]